MKILIGFKSTAATPPLDVEPVLYDEIQEWLGTDERAIAFRAGTPDGPREYSLVRDAVEFIVAVVEEG